VGGVSVEGGGGSGRKSVDSNINMVPMIDLLISVIAFLLMTAVWVQTGVLQASQPRGAPTPESTPERQEDQLKIQINPTGVRVLLTQADAHDISNATPGDASRMLADLREHLGQRHQQNMQTREVWLQPDSAVTYNTIIQVMDVVYEVWGGSRSPNSQQRISELVTIRFL
jgi:biopolymer transport protein ExbD